MDPLTIVVGVGSLLGSVAKVIVSCNDFHIRYNLTIDLLPTIVAECELMKLGFLEIEKVLSSRVKEYQDKGDLLRVLENTLAGCSLVLTVLTEEIDVYLQHGPGQEPCSNHRSKIHFLLNESKLPGLLSQLRGQQQGLTFMLQILQTQSANGISETTDEILLLVRSSARYLAEISQRAQSLRSVPQDDSSDRLDTGSIFRFSDSSEKRTSFFAFDKEEATVVPYRKSSKQSRDVHRVARKTRMRVKPSSEGARSSKNSPAQKSLSLGQSDGRTLFPVGLVNESTRLADAKTAEHDSPLVDYRSSSFNVIDADDIFVAISTRNHARLQALIESDTDLSIRNRQGHSALSEAVHLGDAVACRMLLQGRAGPEAPCHVKECKCARPIHIAAMLDSTEVLQVLLDNGAAIDGLSAERRNALHWAAEHDCSQAARFLIDTGLDHTATDLRKDTPLHIAVVRRSTAFIETILTHEMVEVPKLLELRNSEDKTPLQLAAESGVIDGLQLLIASGARIAFTDSNDATLLHHAARRSCHQAIILLASYGLNVNARDKDGQTPLHYAMESAFDARRTIRVLLDLGANLEAKRYCRVDVQQSTHGRMRTRVDDDGSTFLGKPRKRRHTSARTKINFGHNGRTPLLVAALKAPALTVECLLVAGADPHALSACGCGALALAKRNKDLSVFRLLAEHLLTAVEAEEVPSPLKLLHLAVATAAGFDRLFRSRLSTPSSESREHGRIPEDPYSIIQRSSEGSCSYTDCSVAHVQAAVASCDEIKVSIHQRYQGLSAVELAVLYWQKGQEDVLRLLLMHESSYRALAAIERAQARLKPLSQDREDEIHPRGYDPHRMLGSRRNELMQQLGDAKAMQKKFAMTPEDPKEREEISEAQNAEPTALGSKHDTAMKDQVLERARSRSPFTHIPMRQLSVTDDPSSKALRISPEPWPNPGKSTEEKKHAVGEVKRTELWDATFGFAPKNVSTSRKVTEGLSRTGVAKDKGRVARLASRVAGFTTKLEMMGMASMLSIDNMADHPSRPATSQASSRQS